MKIRFLKWEEGYNAIELAKLLRNSTQLGLAGAKQCVDKILDDEVVEIELNPSVNSDDFLTRARECNVRCEAIHPS